MNPALVACIIAFSGAPGPAVARLDVRPRAIELRGPYAEARVLVDSVSTAGARDITAQLKMAVADAQVADVDASGIVRPLRDGVTTIAVSLEGKPLARIPVRVTGVAGAPPPRYVGDVLPAITRAGCNMGACHGAGSGKGGFKLSLLGYAPEIDYDSIVRGANGRRVVRPRPEASLILRKATLQVPHKGGRRFAVGSPEYRLIGDWIAAGCPPPNADEAHVVRLEVTPTARTVPIGGRQRFAVQAVFADGRRRDVSGEAVFSSSDESVAKVSPDGEALVTGSGEGAVLLRYQSLVATARVISPFPTLDKPRGTRGTLGAASMGTAGSRESTSHTSHTRHTSSTPVLPVSPVVYPIDRLVNEKLAALSLAASPRCSDAEFIRRAYLDVLGVPPAPDEAGAFLADHDAAKRDRLIDALFARPEYVDNWTLRWGDLLRSNRRFLNEKGVAAFNAWIRRCVLENRPWDQFAREVLLARGRPYEDGPANFFRTAGTPNELAEATSQIFLGVRIQCARCHNHPYEKWTQQQYYQMAAFFTRVKVHRSDRKGDDEPFVALASTGEARNPRTGKDAPPCALDAAPVPTGFHGDRRERLAAWMTSPQNPFFARSVVNRIWKHFLGRGLVEPVDDLRVTNPASNEPLLAWLSRDFTTHGFDLQRLMKQIMRTDTYQRSPLPTGNNARDDRYLSHYPFKRLSAEQLVDALTAATGVAEKFAGYPAGTRACELADAAVPSYFLDLFGRPARNIVCECERNEEPNLGQVLYLMNDAGLNARIADKAGRLAKLLAAKTPDNKLVEELYLASYCRPPSPDELKSRVKALAAAKDHDQAAQDLLWALLNSKEFLFNH